MSPSDLAPVTHPTKRTSMFDDLRGGAVLRGVRGQAGADLDALASLVEGVSQLVDDFPEIHELDLNPVFASESGAVAVDARIIANFSPVPSRATGLLRTRS